MTREGQTNRTWPRAGNDSFRTSPELSYNGDTLLTKGTQPRAAPERARGSEIDTQDQNVRQIYLKRHNEG